MSKIVVVGANHAGTFSINTILDNYGDQNEVVVFDQNSNISFLGCGMPTKKDLKARVLKSI